MVLRAANNNVVHKYDPAVKIKKPDVRQFDIPEAKAQVGKIAA